MPTAPATLPGGRVVASHRITENGELDECQLCFVSGIARELSGSLPTRRGLGFTVGSAREWDVARGRASLRFLATTRLVPLVCHGITPPPHSDTRSRRLRERELRHTARSVTRVRGC